MGRTGFEAIQMPPPNKESGLRTQASWRESRFSLFACVFWDLLAQNNEAGKSLAYLKSLQLRQC
jgi:hypothetical protein